MSLALQTGSVDWRLAHKAVRKSRGLACSKSCEHCGRNADQWAWIHDQDPWDTTSYKPLCGSCHVKYDMTDSWRMKIGLASSIHNAGSKHGSAKLTEEDVLEIRSLYAEGKLRQKDLAEMYEVTTMTISHIVTRRKWKHI